MLQTFNFYGIGECEEVFAVTNVQFLRNWGEHGSDCCYKRLIPMEFGTGGRLACFKRLIHKELRAHGSDCCYKRSIRKVVIKQAVFDDCIYFFNVIGMEVNNENNRI